MGVAMTAAAFQVDEPSALRRELAEGIKAAWHKSCEHVLRIGRLLIEAKDKLAHGEFTQMVLEDMPFGPRQAQAFMELARSPRLSNAKNPAVLPVRASTLKAIDSLTDGEYEAACFHGIIRQDVTEREVRDFQKQITQHETKETGAAWNELAAAAGRGEQSAKLSLVRRIEKMDDDEARDLLARLVREPHDHRPQAVAKYRAPEAPEGTGATTISELMHLFIQMRHALGLSQSAVDERVGWAKGLCSKYEILHQDSGRAPSIDAILDYAQGLKCGLALVVL